MLTTDRKNPVHDRIPDRFRRATLGDLSPELRKTIERAIAENYGVLLYGPTGRGKTHAMAAMARAVREARTERTGISSLPDRWVSWPEMLADMRRAWKMRGEDANRFDPFTWAGYVREHLFVDDVGTETDRGQDDYGIEKFNWLVDTRYVNDLTMSITTNLSLKALEERYGTRTFSRLYSMCQFHIEMTGPDRRIAV